MVNRLMDLVVLVAEFSQQSAKSLKELDKELGHLGYTSEEIQEALFWITSQWRPIECGGKVANERSVFRVLSPWETKGIASEAHGYLLRLQHLGLVDESQFERIMKRITPEAGGRLQLQDIKLLAGRVMFNDDSDGFEEILFQVLDDEMLMV